VAFDRCGILVAQFTTAIDNQGFELGRGAANQMCTHTHRANACPHTVHAFRASARMNMLIHSDRINVSESVSIFHSARQLNNQITTQLEKKEKTLLLFLFFGLD
jgi:hypothetical protein